METTGSKVAHSPPRQERRAAAALPDHYCRNATAPNAPTALNAPTASAALLQRCHTATVCCAYCAYCERRAAAALPDRYLLLHLMRDCAYRTYCTCCAYCTYVDVFRCCYAYLLLAAVGVLQDRR